MLGLLVMLLFAITGITLNHGNWFGAEKPLTVERRGQVPTALLAARDDLRIVEHVRQTFGIRGAMANYTTTDDDVAVAFREPGQVWDVTIERSTGAMTAHHEQYNFAAIINNLHRGRYTGKAWSWVIDISALLIVLACATGFVLWLALPKRRQLGIAALVLGTIATMVVIYFLVPGTDAVITRR